ncbi:MAG: TlpA family protein disulfide reductase [Fibrobacteraceae bacterium]|nr:TlpA family protein disulfide reductase [Fibrobacteraceae bacterium]
MKFVALFLIAFVSFSFAASTQQLELPVSVKDSIPWFAARDNDGGPFTKTHLKKIAQGSKKVALVYFATWCIPCRVGLKQIKENENVLSEKGVKVVLVNVGENDSKLISDYISKMKLEVFPLIKDNYKRLSEGFGLVKENEIFSLPRTLLLDENLKPLKYLGQEGEDFIELLVE